MKNDKFNSTHIKSQFGTYETNQIARSVHRHLSHSSSGRSKADVINERNSKKADAVARTFYQDYQQVRNDLFAHLQAQNSDLNAYVILEKTQKVLERIVMVCFCEDHGLLSHNGCREAIQAARQPVDPNGTKAWHRLNRVFDFLYHKNLELAAGTSYLTTDHVLDQLTVRDAIFPSIEKLTGYDYAAELDVSVLGHMFEQSIHDMEYIKTELLGHRSEPERGIRNQNGIFYTSSGVAEQLLEETLYSWIEDRRAEIVKRLSGDGQGTLQEAVSTGYEKMQLTVNQKMTLYRELRQQLNSVTILDPAAGSGALLNSAFDRLVLEREKLTQKLAKLQEGQVASSHDNWQILHRNLYGVDLHEESIGIARLSLWLKSGHKYDEWTSLQDNLKTGNSIIDQSDVSDKAFNWHEAFPAIMNDGGFDIIIANPPYVFTRDEGLIQKEKSYFKSRYHLSAYQLNTYLLFIERSYELLKEGGWLGFIVPNNWLTIDSCRKMRRFLLQHTGNLKIINMHGRMFADAAIDTCLLIFQKTAPTTVKLGEYINERLEIVAEVEPEQLLNEQSIINISLMKNERVHEVMNRIEAGHFKLASVATVKSGLLAYEVGRGNPAQTRNMKENRIYHSARPLDETYWMYLEGKDVRRYSLDWHGTWLKYGPNLAARRHEALFTLPRILVRQIPAKSMYAISAAYAEKEMLNDRNANNIIDFQKDPLFLLGVLNSKITTFWFIHKFDKFQRRTFPQFKVKDLKMFPIPDVSESEMKRLSKAVDQMLHVQRQKSEKLQPMGKLIQKEKQLNEQIDQYAAAAFGLSDEDVRLIDDRLASFLE
ncbi:Eco57I restriction-modification methylase domain-containing protein [Lentibacillus salinarum]|uniref:site-specific DNA-methyltransferase (adenine-specific) n=1 Tax=Lentibacillus salinarum TaxID=446820 RepID=A0ABW3ZWA0_9BACI